MDFLTMLLVVLAGALIRFDLKQLNDKVDRIMAKVSPEIPPSRAGAGPRWSESSQE